MRDTKFRDWEYETKFRIWDCDNETWTFVTLYDLTLGACTPDGDKPLTEGSQPFEQFTGLKDKNGKDIYDGDICFFTSKTGKYMSTVWWISDLGSFGLRIVKNNFLYTFSELDTMGVNLDTLEVIGNIHENVELLKEKKCVK